MDPVSFRRRERLSQARLAEALGLGIRSKGYISRLENGLQPWPLELALKLERFSNGLVKATDLCPEAAELLPVARAEARAS